MEKTPKQCLKFQKVSRLGDKNVIFSIVYWVISNLTTHLQFLKQAPSFIKLEIDPKKAIAIANLIILPIQPMFLYPLLTNHTKCYKIPPCVIQRVQVEVPGMGMRQDKVEIRVAKAELQKQSHVTRGCAGVPDLL